MAGPAPGDRKLGFRVVFASTEDTEYPVTELNFHSPQTKGWQSARCVPDCCCLRYLASLPSPAPQPHPTPAHPSQLL